MSNWNVMLQMKSMRDSFRPPLWAIESFLYPGYVIRQRKERQTQAKRKPLFPSRLFQLLDNVAFQTPFPARFVRLTPQRYYSFSRENLPTNFNKICNLFWYMWPNCKITKTLDIFNPKLKWIILVVFSVSILTTWKLHRQYLGNPIHNFCVLYM